MARRSGVSGGRNVTLRSRSSVRRWPPRRDRSPRNQWTCSRAHGIRRPAICGGQRRPLGRSMICRRLLWRRMVRPAGTAGSHGSRTLKRTRPLSCRNRRPAMVHGGELRSVSARRLLLPPLCDRWRVAPLPGRSLFHRGRSRSCSAVAAVVADTIYRGHVVDAGPVVNVGDVRGADVIHSAVVIECAVIPNIRPHSPIRRTRSHS